VRRTVKSLLPDDLFGVQILECLLVRIDDCPEHPISSRLVKRGDGRVDRRLDNVIVHRSILNRAAYTNGDVDQVRGLRAEGVGDHGCEYMTEGVVVILGETGRNFGAGMSNGVAYVFDERREFPKKVNEELVGLEQVTRAADVDLLYALVERHARLTGSARARAILGRWDHHLKDFWKVAPHLALTEEGPQTVVYRDSSEAIRDVSAERGDGVG
jgi:glutamate synthase domain-containing protein 3